MPFFARISRDAGCGATTPEGSPYQPARTRLLPRSAVEEDGAKTPATPPTSNGRGTGSTTHRPLRSFMGCTMSTPKTRAGFSVSVSNDAFSPFGLDERQEVANRSFKIFTMKILSNFIDKSGASPQLRKVAELELAGEFVEKSAERNRAGEVSLR